MGTITIVGLGPGPFGLITMETWEKMQQAEQLLLRTTVHPTVVELEKRGLRFSSYDTMYETGATFDEVYSRIAADVVRRAKEGQHVVYAVPGSPLVAERTVIMIRELARQEGQSVHILPGMSFAEVLYVRLGNVYLAAQLPPHLLAGEDLALGHPHEILNRRVIL